jgi:hypothetical protein
VVRGTNQVRGRDYHPEQKRREARLGTRQTYRKIGRQAGKQRGAQRKDARERKEVRM